MSARAEQVRTGSVRTRRARAVGTDLLTRLGARGFGVLAMRAVTQRLNGAAQVIDRDGSAHGDREDVIMFRLRTHCSDVCVTFDARTAELCPLVVTLASRRRVDERLEVQRAMPVGYVAALVAASARRFEDPRLTRVDTLHYRL